MTALEFAQGVHVSEGVERDVNEVEGAARARSGQKEGGGGSGGSSSTSSSCVEKRCYHWPGTMMMVTARCNKGGEC